MDKKSFKEIITDFGKRLLSRKWLVTIAGIVLIVGNAVFEWGLGQEDINALIVFIGGYVVVEGVADYKSR